jgi:Fic family protein
MLGECQSKCEHIAGAPLDPEIAKQLHTLYLLKGIRGTAAIEGNTLTEAEIQKKIDGSLVLPPSREYLGQEVQNIVDGLGRVLSQAMDGKPLRLCRETFETLNSILLGNLEREDDVRPGEVRKNSVGVLRYRGAPAEDCCYLLDRLGDWLRGKDFEGPLQLSTSLAILKAIVAHLYLAWIHPFGDGNGRTARLVEFSILFSAGIPTPAAHLLSNHYNLTRSEYYRQLEYASESGGDITRFVKYAVQGLLDGLREQLEAVRNSQLSKIWKNYVFEAFGNTTSAARVRQRQLVLDLSKEASPVRVSKLMPLSPATALAYGGAKLKLSRDLNELQRMGLILRSRNGVTANKDLVKAFLPMRAVGPINVTIEGQTVPAIQPNSTT